MLTEIILDYITISNIKIKNLINVLLFNLCYFLMQKLIRLQFKIKLIELSKDYFDITLMNLFVLTIE